MYQLSNDRHPSFECSMLDLCGSDDGQCQSALPKYGQIRLGEGSMTCSRPRLGTVYTVLPALQIHEMMLVSSVDLMRFFRRHLTIASSAIDCAGPKFPTSFNSFPFPSLMLLRYTVYSLSFLFLFIDLIWLMPCSRRLILAQKLAARPSQSSGCMLMSTLVQVSSAVSCRTP